MPGHDLRQCVCHQLLIRQHIYRHPLAAQYIFFVPEGLGLSCRTVDSNPLKFESGYVYLGGRDEVFDLEIQPTIISAGGESWNVSGVKSTITRWPRPGYNDWLNDFAEEAVNTVNNSNTEYSAEIDSNPGSIIFYSPSGEVESNISIEIDMREINAPQFLFVIHKSICISNSRWGGTEFWQFNGYYYLRWKGIG